MGVKYEMVPAITDVRHIPHATAMGMFAMDWLAKDYTRDYTTAEVDCTLLVYDVLRHCIMSCDPEKKSLTYRPAKGPGMIKIEPAGTEGINITYCPFGKNDTTVVCNWSLEQYAENTEDWYE